MKDKKLKGIDVLNSRQLSKSIAFTTEEREKLGLRGLLPHATITQDMQLKRVVENIRRKESDIEKYVFLAALRGRNERLFYKTIVQNIEEMMPLIYTPTVGQACKEYSQIFRRTAGFFITPEDKGEIYDILKNWPHKNVKVVVVTDGQRILGLGDLGANGMGIPIGKLSLYTACAGIKPEECLPVMLDVGTNNEENLNDILYLGYPHIRLKGKPYFDLVEEFVMAIQKRFPKALIQFEDFLTPNAYTLMKKYRNRVLCFNDDIQGTAAVALSGVYASSRITNIAFKDYKIMFLGAGSAATGIADLMTSAFESEGFSKEKARERLHFVDINGLMVKSRKDLMDHNLPYADDMEPMDFITALKTIKPNVLIGATGSPNTFTKEVIEIMCENHERPVVFALSNPTSRAECTAEEAYKWSDGKVAFASGSPFGTIKIDGRVFKPGQGNNAYVFPGIGLGAISCEAKRIPDEFFLVAAKTLAYLVTEENIALGSLYPSLKVIRDISLEIAVNVAEKAYEMCLAQKPRPRDIRKEIKEYMYQPTY